jgi:hypothetical protein
MGSQVKVEREGKVSERKSIVRLKERSKKKRISGIL